MYSTFQKYQEHSVLKIFNNGGVIEGFGTIFWEHANTGFI